MCLTTAKQGQLQPDTKNNKKNNIIKSTNDVKDQEIILKQQKETRVKCII
jgi:hypothetical protein